MDQEDALIIFTQQLSLSQDVKGLLSQPFYVFNALNMNDEYEKMAFERGRKG